MIEPELRSIKNFSEVYIENWPREIFFIDSVLKTNPWTYKIKGLSGEKIMENF